MQLPLNEWQKVSTFEFNCITETYCIMNERKCRRDPCYLARRNPSSFYGKRKNRTIFTDAFPEGLIMRILTQCYKKYLTSAGL